MTAALSIKNLYKTYNNGFEALKGISLDVQPGDFFALLGPNGAGKSTTIGIICSLIRKSAGKLSIFDVDIDENFALAKQQIGIVPQEFNFNNFETVFNIIRTQGGFYGLNPKLAKERAELYLKKLGLWDKRDIQSRMLSGGMKRRLMIARALIHHPKLLILDEPTAGVDIELRRSMWAFLKEINTQGTTIILTTHYLEEAESLCRNVAIINHGEIIHNTSVKSLLRELNKEVFIFDCVDPIEKLPELLPYQGRLIDNHSFELEVEKGQLLNDVFTKLSAQQVRINSMRNKANRLEELFINLVSKQLTEEVAE